MRSVGESLLTLLLILVGGYLSFAMPYPQAFLGLLLWFEGWFRVGKRWGSVS